MISCGLKSRSDWLWQKVRLGYFIYMRYLTYVYYIFIAIDSSFNATSNSNKVLSYHSKLNLTYMTTINDEFLIISINIQ